jgi:hypothetical protein
MNEPEEENTKKARLEKVASRLTWVVIVVGFCFIGYGIVTGLSKIFSM